MIPLDSHGTVNLTRFPIRRAQELQEPILAHGARHVRVDRRFAHNPNKKAIHVATVDPRGISADALIDCARCEVSEGDRRQRVLLAQVQRINAGCDGLIDVFLIARVDSVNELNRALNGLLTRILDKQGSVLRPRTSIFALTLCVNA